MAKRTKKARTAARKGRATRAKPRSKATPRKKAAKWSPPVGPGTFCWQELMTTNPEASLAFYGALFGWTSRPMPLASGEAYHIVLRGADGVAGLQRAEPSWEGDRTYWIPSVSVEDVDATVARAQGLGGSVVCPPTDVEGFGRYAVLRDPQGALISLWRSKP